MCISGTLLVQLLDSNEPLDHLREGGCHGIPLLDRVVQLGHLYRGVKVRMNSDLSTASREHRNSVTIVTLVGGTDLILGVGILDGSLVLGDLVHLPQNTLATQKSQ